MPDAHYISPKLAEIYDIDSPWSIDRDFYLSLAGPPRQSILDLGCGTGLLCEAYAGNGHDVTGVDPSSAMLDSGRQKPHGKSIVWVESSAQNFRSDKLFDLIIMTGHAFQVLLEDSDVLATFSAMRSCLKDGGLIAFESRNPEIEWGREWDYQMSLETPAGIVVESRRMISLKNERMIFELLYHFPDEVLSSMSELRFMPRTSIERHLKECGLQIERLLGDWDGTAFNEQTSKEMIFLVRAA